MLEDKQWDENTVLTIISDQQKNPFIIKETIESIDVDWENTSEVLNQTDTMLELMAGW